MIETGPASAIPEDGYQIFDTAEGRWIVIQTDGEFHALLDRCGHFPQSMAGGRLTDHRWRCPHHGVIYDIRTGEVVDDSGFVDIDPLETAACIVRDGIVFIATDRSTDRSVD